MATERARAIAQAVVGAAVAVAAAGVLIALVGPDGADRTRWAGNAAWVLVLVAPLAAAGACAAGPAPDAGGAASAGAIAGVVGAAAGVAGVLVVTVVATVALAVLTGTEPATVLEGVRPRTFGWPLLLTPIAAGGAALLASLGRSAE